MFKKFIKIFIKNSEDTESKEVRLSYGKLAGTSGIILNSFMSIAKIVVGIITGAISILSDGINNLSDAGSSIITIIGFKLSAKKPDRKHPYGHGRMEYFAGLAVSAIIVVVAIELFKSSITKIIENDCLDMNLNSLFYITIIILGVSIILKLIMAMFNNYVSKTIKSVAMHATFVDSLCDTISTTLVLVCTILSLYVKNIPLDGIAGIIVSIFIGYTGVKSLFSIVSPLLGEVPDKEDVKKLKNFVLNCDKNVVGVHDIMFHDYGPGRKLIVLHVEVPAEGNVLELHDMIDNIERKTELEFNCIVTIHMDPVVTNSERVNELKAKCIEIVKSVDDSYDIHDFRMNEGPTHANVIFDLSIPFEGKYTNEEAKKIVEEKLKEYDSKINAVINAENPLV